MTEVPIKPFQIERVCPPGVDVEQLAFTAIEATESTYSRALIHLQGATLPHSIQVDAKVPASVPRMLYRRQLNGEKDGDQHRPPEAPQDPKPPEETPPPGDDGDATAPSIVPLDLFVMLKYRQDWRREGYGIGDLLFTTSLMPDEELVLEVKTWETSKTQQDVDDTTDNRNTSDIKTTKSSANESATEDQAKTHEYIDGKASYSGFGASAEVSAGWSEDVSNLQRNLEKQSQERSVQSSNEYRASRKVHMAVSRETGSESKTTRRVRNVNQAHTLNVNYYEVLSEYEVSLTPYEASLVVLGAEPDFGEASGYVTWTQPSEPLSVGHLIRLSQSAPWIEHFLDVYGVSPIKILRSRWASPLYDAALVELEWWGDEGLEIAPEVRKEFQRTVLRYVRPTPGWVEPDEQGALRWGYEILEGCEKELLTFLYSFLPFSVQQVLGRARFARLHSVAAANAMAARFARALTPSYEHLPSASPRSTGGRSTPESSYLQLADTRTLLVNGPFDGVDISNAEKWREKAGEWTELHVIDQLDRVRENVGKPSTAWRTTLPTQGVYADLSLGRCSGAEDYIEITRQYDLEMKRLEIKRLELENERLRLGNEGLASGEPSVRISADADSTIVKLNVDTSTKPCNVEVKAHE